MLNTKPLMTPSAAETASSAATRPAHVSVSMSASFAAVIWSKSAPGAAPTPKTVLSNFCAMASGTLWMMAS